MSFLRGDFEVCVKSEDGTIGEGDGGILCFEVDGWIHTGEPWHAEDEIKVTEVGNSGSARCTVTLNVNIDVPSDVTGVLTGPVGHADVHVRGFNCFDLVTVGEAFVEEILLGTSVEKGNGRSAVNVHGVSDEDVREVRKFDCVDVIRNGDGNGIGNRGGYRRCRWTQVELVDGGVNGERKGSIVGPECLNLFPWKVGPPLGVG